MIGSILKEGLYRGEGSVEQRELGLQIPFLLSWELSLLDEGAAALQKIYLQGEEPPLENSFHFTEGGGLLLKSALLGEIRGNWRVEKGVLSWNLQEEGLFEGVERIFEVSPGEFRFESLYSSSGSKNHIVGSFMRL